MWRNPPYDEFSITTIPTNTIVVLEFDPRGVAVGWGDPKTRLLAIRMCLNISLSLMSISPDQISSISLACPGRSVSPSSLPRVNASSFEEFVPKAPDVITHWLRAFSFHLIVNNNSLLEWSPLGQSETGMFIGYNDFPPYGDWDETSELFLNTFRHYFFEFMRAYPAVIFIPGGWLGEK